MRVDETLRGLWREVKPSSRQTYRNGWATWTEWCGRVGVDPCRASVPEAQAWVESQRQAGFAPNTIRRRARAAGTCLEYLAMMGHQPSEPFGRVELPTITRRGPQRGALPHDPVTDTLLGRLLAGTRGDDRVHGIVWAAAGMGLSTGEIGAMTPERIIRVGDTSVAVVQRAAGVRLVPIPRELLLVIERVGWPMTAPRKSAGVRIGKILRPHANTCVNDLRQWHRECAVRLGVDPDRVEASLTASRATGMQRWNFSGHSANVVCAHLRQLLLDNLDR